MRPDDRFRAQLTKTFVATVVLQLVGEGKPSLGHRRALASNPALRRSDHRAPAAQLHGRRPGTLHRSGSSTKASASGPGRRGDCRGQADQPQMFPSGSAWSYSNTGWRAGWGSSSRRSPATASADELARRDLPGRCGCKTPTPRVSFSSPWPARTRGAILAGSRRRSGRPIEGPLLDFTVYNPSSLRASGNIVSNGQDLARFFRALFGGRLLSAAGYRDVQRPVRDRARVGIRARLLHRGYAVRGRCSGTRAASPGSKTGCSTARTGSRQMGVMINADEAPAAASEPFTTVAVERGTGGVLWQPCARPASRARRSRRRDRRRRNHSDSVAVAPRSLTHWPIRPRKCPMKRSCSCGG